MRGAPKVHEKKTAGALNLKTATASAVCACLLSLALFPSVAQAASSAAADAAVSNSSGIGDLMKSTISFILHLDVHLADIVSKFGTLTYGILFAIVFAETGLVVTPILPGDSLLFATGALAALGRLNIFALLALYAVAATVGDAVNYSVGKYFGTKALSSKLVKKEYIQKTESFYSKYGGKTIVLARFVPIVRTFAPFVAGVGSMAYKTFALYNVVGALLWTGICVGAGYVFGNIPIVQENFSLVVLGIIIVSVIPVVYEIAVGKMKKRPGGRSGVVAREGQSLQVRFS
jgi:membrane-associated protein